MGAMNQNVGELGTQILAACTVYRPAVEENRLRYCPIWPSRGRGSSSTIAAEAHFRCPATAHQIRVLKVSPSLLARERSVAPRVPLPCRHASPGNFAKRSSCFPDINPQSWANPSSHSAPGPPRPQQPLPTATSAAMHQRSLALHLLSEPGEDLLLPDLASASPCTPLP
jgi:hypothetical protein